MTLETRSLQADTRSRTLLARMGLLHFSSLKEPIVRAFLLAVLLTCCAASRAADVSAPLVLVAKPELRDGYAGTILVVRPLGGDAHVGFVVNRPSGTSLGEMFPAHDPAQKLVDPVYSGGPLAAEAIFALMQRPDAPGGKSVQILPGLFVAIDEATVDRIIETESDRARFVAGLVAWQPGELANEIEQGAWYVLEADAALAMRNPEGLWEELVHRSSGVKLAI
jgi:putative transcriptional regulator